MNIARPSLAHTGQAHSTYEHDLVAELGLEGAQSLREFNDIRARTGQGLRDHELAIRFPLQDVMDLAAVGEDMALAHLLEEGPDLEDNDHRNASGSHALP
ncbi:hypothetical protein ID866_6214 [Astraeus odoratus]|nr:hypothetical protein ID866_6214 [Astraeus odoratus]